MDKKTTSLQWKTFRKKLARLLNDAIRLSRRKREYQSKDYDRRKGQLYHRLEEFLKTGQEDKDAKRLIKRLKRHKHELFTFLEYDNVSPYNNHAEQQMRKPVQARKISQQNRSEEGTKAQAILMTLFRSAELQGKDPVETVLALAKAVIGKQEITDENLRLAA